MFLVGLRDPNKGFPTTESQLKISVQIADLYLFSLQSPHCLCLPIYSKGNQYKKDTACKISLYLEIFCSFHLISNALIGTLLCPGNRQTKTTSLHWDPGFLRIVLWRRHQDHFSHKYVDGLNVKVIVWQRQMQVNRCRPYKL